MNWVALVNQVIVIFGIPAIIGGAIVLGRKLEILDRVQKSIDDELRPDLKDIRERFFVLEGKTANMFQTASPVELVSKGKEFLTKTGLDAYIDTHFEEFFAYCNQNLKMKTAYDIQNSIFEYFDGVKFERDFERTLKEFAYQEGISMDVVRRIGAIYLRNLTLERLKMDKAEIDRNKAPDTKA